MIGDKEPKPKVVATHVESSGEFCADGTCGLKFRLFDVKGDGSTGSTLHLEFSGELRKLFEFVHGVAEVGATAKFSLGGEL
jgi:hypothetical protein